MMKLPLVSVIIPVYNVEKYVGRCLDSVCGQTYKELEIIVVVDQNFQDNCLAICEEYAMQDNRIRVATEEVQALGAARDKGISLAQGEWICFVDSDDFIHPQYVEILLKTVIENDCLTAQCKHQKVYNDDIDYDLGVVNVLTMDWRSYFFYVVAHANEGYTPYGVWCNIYHKSLLKNIRFGPVRYAEDSGFTPRIIYEASTKPIAVINQVLYYYYQREGSLLNSKASLIILDRYFVKKGAMDFWKEHSEMELYALFHNDFLYCMILDYIKLCLELPEEYSKYSFLEGEIEHALKEEVWYGLPTVLLYPGAREIWNKLKEPDRKFILYGYGHWGKKIFYLLRYLGLDIREIWDQNANDMESIEGIPIKKKYTGYEKGVTFLIAIENSAIAYQVQSELRKAGYERFMIFHVFWEGLRYGVFERYLPCIINNYERLLK